MKHWYMIVGVLLLLIYSQGVSAYNITEQVDGYRIDTNESELPINIPFNRTLTQGFYSIASGSFVEDSGGSINLTNTTVYHYNLSINNLPPNVYDTFIEFDGESGTNEVLFTIVVHQEFEEDVFDVNTSESFINLSVNRFARTVYDIELPYTEELPITFRSPPDEEVTFTCSTWFTCPGAMTPTTDFTTIYVTLAVPTNVAHIYYERWVEIGIANKSGRVFFDISVEKAQVIVKEVTEYRYEDINFTNLTSTELIAFFEQFQDQVSDAVDQVEAANRPIIEEVEVEVDRYVPVTSVTEELKIMEQLKTEFQTEQAKLSSMRTDLEAERLRLSAQIRNISEQVHGMATDVQSMPTPAQLRQEAKLELIEESRWPKWLRVTLWIIALTFVAFIFAITILRLRSER